MNPCGLAVKSLVVFSIPVASFGFQGPWSLPRCYPVYQFLWHQFDICKIHTRFYYGWNGNPKLFLLF